MTVKQIYHILQIFILVYTVVRCRIAFPMDCMTPNNIRGVCVEIPRCKKLFDQVLNDNTDVFPFIRASRCDFYSYTSLPKVCCGPDINFTNTSDSDASDENVSAETELVEMIISTVPPSATEHSVMPRICGKQKLIVENRIFGGKEASVGEFPWLARLVHFDEYNRTNLGCSGFLIHRKFILTAAHCLVGNVIRYLGPVQSVTLGIHNDTMSRICTAEFCIDPSRNVLVLPAIVHPNYDSYTKHNDIAVIPLKEKVQFTDYIKAICLSRTTTNASHFTVSGWGRTESGFNSKVKLKVDIPKANRTLCEQQYRTLGILISDKQVCAGGERGNDACTGDSGGPLMAMNDLGTAWYAEGIVSIGPSNCGTEGWPGVYTYIPKYYDWIIEQIKNNIKTYNVGR